LGVILLGGNHFTLFKVYMQDKTKRSTALLTKEKELVVEDLTKFKVGIRQSYIGKVMPPMKNWFC